MPRRRHPALATRILPALVLAPLAGCGVLVVDGDLDESFGDMAWVEDARSECHDFACTVEVDLIASAEPDQVVEALQAAFDLEAKDVVLALGDDVTAKVSASSPDAVAAPLAEVLAWAAATPELTSLDVAALAGEQLVSVKPAAADAFWPAVRTTWEATAALPARSLEAVAVSDASPGDRRFSASRDLPDAQVERALALDERSRRDGLRLSGIAVVGDALVVGVPRGGDLAPARAAVADLPRAGEARTTEVVVTSDLLELSRHDPASRQAAAALSETLGGLPQVEKIAFPGARSAQVRLAPRAGLEEARAVLARVRAEKTPFASLTFLTADGDEVEMTAAGDDTLLALAASLQRELPGRTTLDVRQRPGRPPYLGIEVQVDQPRETAPDLAPRVAEVARAVAAHDGPATGYHLGLEVAGPTGRSASTDWTVEVTPDGPVVVEADVLPRVARMVRRSWAEALGQPVG